jgi:hypothetical protein
METIDFIREFIDLLKDSGHNTLVLYLEGRIKTKTFPYPAEGEYYTPEEMKQVVEYATSKGIDVVPVVSVFGHAEQFLKHPELANLAELRGDGSSPLEETINHVFCLSLPDTRTFLKSYLAEIAEIFPSKHLHLGCDEAWDTGICPLCSARIADGETVGDLFADYLSDMRNFVVDELGREVIIWDDMFECFEGCLEKIPRDVILCCWQYGRNVQTPKAHFKNRLEFDLLAEYERLGFRYIFAPAGYYAGNIETLTEYAAKHNPLGGLLTIWEKSLNFMMEPLPLVNYSGKLWSGTSEGFESDMSEFFGCGDEMFLKTLRAVYEIPLIHPTRLSPQSYLTGPLTEIEQIFKSACAANKLVLESYLPKLTDGRPRDVLDDMLTTLQWRGMMYAFREAAEELYTLGVRKPTSGRRSAIIAESMDLVDSFLTKKLEQWKRFRSGLEPAKLKNKFETFKKEFAEFAEKSADVAGLLKVRFCIPDMYNAQKCAFTLEFEDGAIEKVAEGVYKEFEMKDAFFTFEFPYETRKKPVALTVESWLYGGIGIAYAEIATETAVFAPAAVAETVGRVTDASNLLVNDLRYCWMGESDMAELFRTPSLASRKHSVRLLLDS